MAFQPQERQADPLYEVYAIRYGRSLSRKSDLYFRYGSYQQDDGPQQMDFFFYVLRTQNHIILVDTGFNPASVALRPGRQCLTAPREALARLGITPSDVDQVIVTHLHWDHIGNVNLFPDTPLSVAEAELEFWSDPVARHPQFWSHVDVRDIDLVLRAHHDGRVRACGPDEIVAPGVRALTVGGHSAGQQILIVQTVSGAVVLASDAAHLYEELELSRPFAITVDLRRMIAAYKTIGDLRTGGATVVPGHDPEVTLRYPTVGGDAAGIAFRIA